MAEIRINTTGGLKLYDADNSHYAQIVAGTITSNVDAITLGHNLATFNAAVTATGILKTDDTTEATSTTDGSLQTDGGLSVAKDTVMGDDLKLLSDASVIHFGANSEVTLTHSHDAGLNLKHTATADDKPVVLTLQTGETDMAANDVIGKIAFQSPDEATGTDAILVSAAIQAVAEGDHSSSSNATRIEFMVGASEAAAKKMQLTSAGKLEVDGGIDIEGGAVFNEDSADVDFRVESNGNANMLVVNGGGDRVGVGADPDMGVGLHIKSGDCGAGGPNAGGDELVVEGSGNTGISIMSGSSSNGTIFFGDSGNDAIGSIDYDHADNDFNITAEGTIMVNLSGGSLTINNAGSDGGVPLYVAQSTNNGQCGHLSHTGTSQTADNLFVSTYTTGTGFNFIRCQSDYDSGEDDEWRVRGDGATLADGSYSSSGADYAEYFESKTGNTVAKGITVVMDGTKVKASTDSDSASSIVGVVRPKDFGKSGSVIGNAASNYWNQKYETDDFGSYVLEDVSSVEWDYRGAEDDIEGTRNHINNQTNVVSFYTDRVPTSITVPADGVANKKVTTGLKRRKLNSSYDKTKTYTSREERDEWLLVGMLGQVQVTKGQKTGDRWIKMRDISETVEEWLIR